MLRLIISSPALVDDSSIRHFNTSEKGAQKFIARGSSRAPASPSLPWSTQSRNRKSQHQHGRNQRQRAGHGIKAGPIRQRYSKMRHGKHAFRTIHAARTRTEQIWQITPTTAAVIARKAPARTWLRRDNLEIRSRENIHRKQGVKRDHNVSTPADTAPQGPACANPQAGRQFGDPRSAAPAWFRPTPRRSINLFGGDPPVILHHGLRHIGPARHRPPQTLPPPALKRTIRFEAEIHVPSSRRSAAGMPTACPKGR